MNIAGLEGELRRCCALGYRWGAAQYDEADRLTRFVYGVSSFADAQARIARLPADLHDYARARWLNFWSAQGVQAIFCAHPRVTAHPDKYHKTIDFYIDGIPFDHKTTVLPAAFPGGIDAALAQPRALIDWLYTNQSGGQRNHSANRLFLVLYDAGGEHWRQKAELQALGASIGHYLDHFDPVALHQMGDGVVADCIWHLANDTGREG